MLLEVSADAAIYVGFMTDLVSVGAVRRFDAAGRFMGRWQVEGEPRGLAAEARGGLYVGLATFEPTVELYRDRHLETAWPEPGLSIGLATGSADTGGQVVFALTQSDAGGEIVKRDAAGAELGRWPVGRGTYDVAYGPLPGVGSGAVYALGSSPAHPARVAAFDAHGTPRTEWYPPGLARGLDVDADGRVVVGILGDGVSGDAVEWYSPEGLFVKRCALAARPVDLALDPQGRPVLLVETTDAPAARVASARRHDIPPRSIARVAPSCGVIQQWDFNRLGMPRGTLHLPWAARS
jgi:hypothetical protein